MLVIFFSRIYQWVHLYLNLEKKWKKDWQYNGKKKNKTKRTNNNLQSTTQKTKDRATWTQLKIGDDLGELMCSGRVGSSCSTCGIRHVGNWYVSPWIVSSIMSINKWSDEIIIIEHECNYVCHVDIIDI